MSKILTMNGKTFEWSKGEPTEANTTDFYIDIDAYDTYQKIDGEWVMTYHNGEVVEDQ